MLPLHPVKGMQLLGSSGLSMYPRRQKQSLREAARVLMVCILVSGHACGWAVSPVQKWSFGQTVCVASVLLGGSHACDMYHPAMPPNIQDIRE